MGYPLYVHVGQEADVGKEEEELGDADVLLVSDKGVVVGHGEQGEQVEEDGDWRGHRSRAAPCPCTGT